MVSMRPTRGFKSKFGVQKGTPKRAKMESQNVSKNNTDFNTEKNQTETHGRAVREPKKHQERIQKKLRTQLWAQRKISKNIGKYTVFNTWENHLEFENGLKNNNVRLKNATQI